MNRLVKVTSERRRLMNSRLGAELWM